MAERYIDSDPDFAPSDDDSSNSSILEEMRQEEEEEDDRPLACMHCNKRFKFESRLNIHLQRFCRGRLTSWIVIKSTKESLCLILK